MAVMLSGTANLSQLSTKAVSRRLKASGFRNGPMSALVGFAFFQVVSVQRMRNADVYYARSFHTIRRNSAI